MMRNKLTIAIVWIVAVAAAADDKRIGQAEKLRAAGQEAESLRMLAAAVKAAPAGRDRQEVLELICWRKMPVPRGGREEFRHAVSALAAAGAKGGWLGVYRLYAASLEQDRGAMVAAAKAVVADGVPGTFPTVRAERAHFASLVALLLSRKAAGMAVVTHRSHRQLYALRDLDRGLTREILAGRDVTALRAARDGLRKAYLAASKHLVDRLFALKLAGKDKQRDALLARAKRLTWLTDGKALAKAVAGLDDDQAWRLVVQPMLDSEVALIDSPPDLAAAPRRTKATLTIRGDRKFTHGGTTSYEGSVRAAVAHVVIECDKVSVVTGPGKSPAVLMASGNVKIHGVPGYVRIAADVLTFNSAAGSFTVGGDIRVWTPPRRPTDRPALKFRSCTVTPRGEIRDRKSFLTDFSAATTIDAKLALLERITSTYEDAELPSEVRYLLALEILCKHLTWHTPPIAAGNVLLERLRWFRNSWRWADAHTGEKWMLARLGPAARQELRRQQEKYQKRTVVTLANVPLYWRLTDPRHADVARAVRLLREVTDKVHAVKAKRWVEEIARNNTVLTFDIPGGFARSRDGGLVLDVRNADKVDLKLYRARGGDDLLFATSRIGEDFIYRDHGLGAGLERADVALALRDKRAVEWLQMFAVRRAMPTPTFRRQDLVGQWAVRVDQLKSARIARWPREELDGEDEDHSDESRYFDDACRRHNDRLRKSYRQDIVLESAWQCDRVLWVPARYLTRSGAYVLVAESNAQRAYVPIVVDPLSLTLRRCRDGVFALVSTARGDKPLAGARLSGRDMVRPAVTDAAGAAFLRIFAAGDRAIVAEKDGRYAVGGFGRVFEGVYVSHQELAHRRHGIARQLRELKIARLAEQSMQVYADRHVVAAYTDRPTYRPGQRVGMKLIVRHLPRRQPADEAKRAFRAEDFELARHLDLPAEGTRVRYEVINPRKRAVADGTLTLNDYGTAAGRIELPAETVVGAYSLRVDLAGRMRIVPNLFAVKYYRRPNFRIDVTGLGGKVTRGDSIDAKVAGKYYFGKPVAFRKLSARLVRPDQWRPIGESSVVLDARGEGTVRLPLPPQVPNGRYFALFTLTDDSDRTVTKSMPVQVDRPGATEAAGGLSRLPRFVAVGETFRVTTDRPIVATPSQVTFQPRQGTVAVTLTHVGWQTLECGDDETEIFVYGGSNVLKQVEVAKSEPAKRRLRWVNLTRYGGEDGLRRKWDDHWDRWWDSPRLELRALFDKQHARVGEALRVLVHVPYKRARLLLTVEGRTVVDYAAVEVKEGKTGYYHVLRIPMKKRYLPNFYLRGRIVWDEGPELAGREAVKELAQAELAKKKIDDGSEDPRWCRVDVVDPGAAGGETLKVAVETARREYRPGEEVDVVMRVTDVSGKPRAAEVSLAAVDESIYSFGQDNLSALAGVFRNPRPPRRYLPKTWRSFRGAKWSGAGLMQMHALAQAQEALRAIDQAMASLAQRKELHKLVASLRGVPRGPTLSQLGEMPASRLPTVRLRTDFRATATWQPQLRTGPDGTLKTSFKLPDSLTAYRLTAVALTKDTRLGTARASLRVRQPISVQVFLPRFAVRSDRLMAVALIHNTTPRDRTCTGAWEVTGANVDAVEKTEHTDSAWPIRAAAGKTTASGRVVVPAAGTARVAIWVRADAIGTAKVAFRAGDAQDTDAERRLLPVRPLGRGREVTLTGTVIGRKRINLPAGFIARELTVTLARSRAVEAMDGLRYLVGYPHGCVEQTMSRFLPAVMVQHAVRQTAARLPSDVAKKLPDVLAKGLARLYNFQHADGGWGWWLKDKTNDAMTVYVVYGLARCRLTGTPVDANVLRRGCDYLAKRLRAGRGAIGADLAARAWLALTLAGRADGDALDKAAQRALAGKVNSQARCNLALACHNAARSESALRLFIGLRDWQPTDTAGIALKLNAQVAFREPLDACDRGVAKLVSLRRGHRWPNTRATSWAIEALAEMLRYAEAGKPAAGVQVKVADKTVLAVNDPAELRKLVFRAHADSKLLAGREAVAVELALAGTEPMAFALTATGTQRLDKVEPIGTAVQIRRRYTTPDGKPIDRPLRLGEVIAAHVTVELTQPREYFIIEDRRPSVCEFAADRIFGPPAASAAHVELRDDRICIFHTRLAAGRHEIVYYLRAETAGVSHVLPGVAYPMYNENTRGETAAARLEVK